MQRLWGRFKRPSKANKPADVLAAAARELMEKAGPVPPPDLAYFLKAAEKSLALGFPREEAKRIAGVALAAWASAEGQRTRCYVDLEASTPYLLWLVDPVAGTRRPIPVADLVRILGPRAAS